MAWLLDTNILSEIRKLKSESKVLAFIAGFPLEQLYLSAVTLAELRFGIEMLSQGTSRRDETQPIPVVRPVGEAHAEFGV